MKGDRRIWRGFVIGLALLPLNGLWVLYMEHIGAHGPIPSTISLFFNVVFIIFFLALANVLVRRLRPRWALNQGEMIIIYVMLAMSTSLAGLDGMQVLLPVLTHGWWFANPENRWDQILSNAPTWLTVQNKEILYGYYNGASTFYQPAVMQAWLPPVLWWTGFIAVLVFVCVCVSVLVRAQWSDRERLTFPIIQLPLAVTDPATPLWRSWLLWAGFALAGGIDFVDGLHYLFPAVPYISIAPTFDSGSSNNLMNYIRDMPWAAIGWLPITFYPAVIGMCFLVPLDLLFSCVFFFFWWKAMYVLSAALGLSMGYTEELTKSVFPWTNEQMFGGYVAIALAPMLVGRRYLKLVWLRICGRPSEVDDTGEGMRYRYALIGAVIGILGLAWFAAHGAMTAYLAILFFVMYYVVAIAVARVRAEFGSPVHDFHLAGPGQTMTYIAGTINFRHRDLTMLSLLWWFNRAYRQHYIGNSIEGVQMAARSRSRSGAVVAAMVTGALVGTVVIFWGWLHYAYKMGVASGWGGGDWRGVEMCQNLQSWIESPTQAQPDSLFAMAGGFGITMLLAAARTTFVGWPLHPVAYAISASWSIHLVWMPMIIAWIAKYTIMRYGGLRMYRQALPFFFGLILGESVIGCGWTFMSLVLHVPNYSFWGL